MFFIITLLVFFGVYLAAGVLVAHGGTLDRSVRRPHPGGENARE